METIKTKNERYFSAKSKTTLQCRMLENGMARLSGYINVIGDVSKTLRAANGSKFRERIEKGAFKRDLEVAKKENRNILALLNHNYSRVLGNVQDGTLKLEEDDKGLRFDLETRAENVQGKEFTGCSFGFFDVGVNTERDRNSKMFYRSVNDLELDEVSLLERGYTPAYSQTSVHFERGTNDNPLLYFNLELEDCLKINDEINTLNQREDNNMRDTELLKTRAKETEIEKTEMEETEKMERNIEENFEVKPIYSDFMIRMMDYDAAYRAQCNITDRINEYKSIARKRSLTTKENKELEALDGELEKINRKMDEESIFIKNDRIRHEQDKYEEEKRYKERNTRYSNNENDNYTGYGINNCSIMINNRSYDSGERRRDAMAMIDYFKSRDPIATRVSNLDYENNQAIIPLTISKDIITDVFNVSPVFERTRKFNVPGKLAFPIYDTSEDDVTIVTIGDFKKVDSHFGKMTSIVLNDYVCRAKVSTSMQLENNTYLSVLQFAAAQLVEKYGRFFEKSILIGTDDIEGLKNLTNIVETQSPNDITMNDIINLYDRVNGKYKKNAIWVMHPKTLTKIRQIKDGVGRPQMLPFQLSMGATFYDTIFGNMLYVSDNMPEPVPGELAMYYGDFSEVFCKFSEKLTIVPVNNYDYHIKDHFAATAFDAKLANKNSKGIAALKFAAE